MKNTIPGGTPMAKSVTLIYLLVYLLTMAKLGDVDDADMPNNDGNDIRIHLIQQIQSLIEIARYVLDITPFDQLPRLKPIELSLILKQQRAFFSLIEK